MRNRILFSISVSTLMAVWAAYAWGANQQPTLLDGQDFPAFYYYHGQKVDLPLDPNRLAVKFKNGAASLTASFPGVPILKADPTGIGAWSLLTLAAPMQDATQADSKIKTLLNSPQVEFASPVFQGLNNTWVAITPEILLRFKSEYQAQADALLQRLAPELEIVQRNFGHLSGAYKLKSPSSNGFEVLATANGLAQDAHIEWAEPNAQFSGGAALIPNDPGFPNLWGILNTGQFGGVPDMDMDGDNAWDSTLGCPGIKVLILDTGVEQDHPDINQFPGEDFTGQGGGGGPVNQCDRHGTAVAGCVSAIINNGIGVVGIAPNTRILSARPFISTTPSCTGGWSSVASWTVDALAWGEAQGARVSNNSNWYGFTSSAIDDEYNSTYAAGMVHFAIAGNFSSSDITYPGSIPIVNAVAALTPSGVLASFSNYGIGLDFSAPGTDIYTTDRTGSDGYNATDYVFLAGTSFATPYTAGVAALILSRDPGLTSAQVEAYLQSTCLDLGIPGYDETYGWGFVNAYNAVLAVPAVVGADADGDGTSDLCDNCPSVANSLQEDTDFDHIGDSCDICPLHYNPLQEFIKAGDANADTLRSLSDIIATVNYIFNKPGCSPQPLCWLSSLLCRGDWDGSGTVSLVDVIRGVNFIFNKPGGPWNALPSGVCCLP